MEESMEQLHNKYIQFRRAGYEASELYAIVSGDMVVVSPLVVLEAMIPSCPAHMKDWVEKLRDMEEKDGEMRMMFEGGGVVELLWIKPPESVEEYIKGAFKGLN